MPVYALTPSKTDTSNGSAIVWTFGNLPQGSRILRLSAQEYPTAPNTYFSGSQEIAVQVLDQYGANLSTKGYLIYRSPGNTTLGTSVPSFFVDIPVNWTLAKSQISITVQYQYASVFWLTGTLQSAPTFKSVFLFIEVERDN